MGARELFEEIRATGWTLVERWNAQSETESTILDFKESRTDAFKTDLASDDRDAIAAGVSGFANTEGGVLVFGVECRRADRKGPDMVQAIKPVPALARFAELVKSCAKSMCDPIVAAIDVAPIACPEDASKGVLALFVPRSPGGPHRASGGREGVKGHYFMRTVDSITVMPHRQLAALFAAPAEPRLVLIVAFNPPGEIDVRVRNDGPGAARNVCVRVTVTDPDGNVRGQLRNAKASAFSTQQGILRWSSFGDRALLHPEERLFPEDETIVGSFELNAIHRRGDCALVRGRVDSDTSRPLTVTGGRIVAGEAWAFSHDGTEQVK